MDDLALLVEDYLTGLDDDVLITDSARSYTRCEFVDKVADYARRLDTLWSQQAARPRGVAILLDRGADYLAVIFACWRANGYYLPLSRSSPSASIDTQMRAAGVSVLCELNNEAVVCRATDSVELPPSARSIVKPGDSELAYVIFTSGSTGEKKGVAISRSSFVAYAKGVKTVFAEYFKARSVIINGELTFDITLADFAFALIFRTEICITSQAANLLSLCAMVKRRGVQSIYAVPSTWDKILDLAERINDLSFRGVQNIFSGGEVLSERLVQRMRAMCPDAVIFNMYGPTEFTVNAFYHEITRRTGSDESEEQAVALGRAFPGIAIRIANPISKDEGELYLSGTQMMAGYVNADAPFVMVGDTSYYPTGDLVRRDVNGIVHYVGRLRDYEKVSGYRINLLSIEDNIRLAVNENIKLLILDGKILCVVEGVDIVEQASVRDRIGSYAAINLEIYEVPSRTVFVDKLPLNASGKLDRQAILNLIA
jgi:acyl-CoA synthetase (AMP-forming)/AMP-acid ligase II